MSVDRRLPIPRPGRWESEAFVADHLDHLVERRQMATESPSSAVFRGGQRAADEALAACTVEGYDTGRHEAYPQPRRTVSRLSPWIRHGLLLLPRVWETLVGEPLQPTSNGETRPGDTWPEDTPPETRSVDVLAYREALLRQEYARHWYARLGSRTRFLDDERRSSSADRRRIGDGDDSGQAVTAGSFDRRMGCVEITLDELEEDGWLPDPARRWLASQWAVRHGRSWADAEEYFHRHLLDGSRAANRLGWSLVAGSAGERPFEFSRWQVEERAPGLCASCEMVFSCPIEDWPDLPQPLADGETSSLPDLLPDLLRDADPHRTAGPVEPERHSRPDVVWLTAESLGREDPALVANPELPAVFVFDDRLLGRLRLSSKRLVFLAETLAELATERDLEIWLGDARSVLADRDVAATFTPVPGWRRRADSIEPVETHPWPWLFRPHDGSIASFARWRAEFAEKAPKTGESGSRTIARLV